MRKKIYGWVLFGVLIALVCCSRMYFGVHYPTDVLLGTALGVLIAVLWHLVYRYAYKARYFCLMGLAAALLLIDSGLWTDLAGLAIVAGAYYLNSKRPKMV